MIQPQRFLLTLAVLAEVAHAFQNPSLRLDARSSGVLMAEAPASVSTIQIGELVGSGSYGTVHLCSFDNEEEEDDDSDELQRPLICKRAWTAKELSKNNEDPEYRASRCQHYFEVEQHLFEKMENDSGMVPSYVDTFEDEKGFEWMTFQLVTGLDGVTPARTMADVIFDDSKEQQQQHKSASDYQHQHHHLQNLQNALGLDEDATFDDTLDCVLHSLLKNIAFVHEQKIIHRDVKPGNLLCDPSTQSLVLIDFGSGADMEPSKPKLFRRKQRVGLEDGSSVAVSPIYAAPEVFVRQDRSAYKFDVFSSALVFAQLLFNCLDERTDAGLHQQLEDVNWDMDAWLSRNLSSKVRPVGLEDSLAYLGQRRGLWGLLGAMFRADPDERISSSRALREFEKMLEGKSDESQDGPFFQSVLDLMDCEVPETQPTDFVSPRPLHFVATFRRGIPLGLILSEVGEDVQLEGEDMEKWNEAVKHYKPVDVLIQTIVEGGQAEEMGIFEIGDKLEGIGDLPLRRGGGFEAVFAMFDKQPRRSTHVKVHFARHSDRPQEQKRRRQLWGAREARVVDEGAFTLRGRRGAQEDAFVLHDVQNPRPVLIAGVFDGHGGTAASRSAAKLMPSMLTEELAAGGITTRQALELAWQTTCDIYRAGCDDEEGTSCIAEYDPVEGILMANTGSSGIVAGTTASVVTVSGNEITVLNCGDSRTLFIANSGNVEFETVDHSPGEEFDRLLKGVDEGLDYSMPECSIGKWYMPIGELSYAVSRSLEGDYVTSKGIVSDPDVTSLRAQPGLLLMATDGLFEVVDNDQVARQAARLKRRGVPASEAAKKLCRMAYEKGTSDNVSVVIVYLD